MELRMFDSVDSFDDFMRNIEFVEAVCRFVKETSMKSLWPNLLMEYVSERKKTFPHVHRFFQNTLF
jgi:hypothetical protein